MRQLLQAVELRLAGGSYGSGRVEVKFGTSDWGTVCYPGFDDTDAGVVCRQLGLGSKGSARNYAYYGQGSGPIWMNDLECTGSESSLAECPFGGWKDWSKWGCAHWMDVSVECRGVLLLFFVCV